MHADGHCSQHDSKAPRTDHVNSSMWAVSVSDHWDGARDNAGFARFVI
jgi:hypothetical protein